MDINKMTTSKIFRLWNVTDEKTYMYGVVLDGITFKYSNGGKAIFFSLRERLFENADSHLLKLKEDDSIAILYGLCENPSEFQKEQVISNCRVDFVNQIDIKSIIRAVEINAQFGMAISEKEMEDLLRIMKDKNG